MSRTPQQEYDWIKTRLIACGFAAGVEWLLVEQDETEGSGLDAVSRSFDAMQRFLKVAA